MIIFETLTKTDYLNESIVSQIYTSTLHYSHPRSPLQSLIDIESRPIPSGSYFTLLYFYSFPSQSISSLFLPSPTTKSKNRGIKGT